ncbi:TIGR01459 family HAD-type hydrolase [Methyloligella solikamskensis]|uniref:TIGR01459 family HAD-type hydrolase n=1 Tax=Methyloligella solikamskensis TaxID=1177756 RepID=A0ABW3JCY4_9HYPH
MLDSVAEFGHSYPAWIVDIWGVMHDGVSANEAAVAATAGYRAQGGVVLLLSNSPRPSPEVQAQLGALGVIEAAYDDTLTSGDLTRHELEMRPGAKVFHLGPERDLPIFKDLDLTLVESDKADLVVCSGLFNDEVEGPEDYNDLLSDMAARKLPMLCANPDHMVERGEELIYCAGALADVYEDFGGDVTYAGKPYAPIYQLAFKKLSDLASRELEPREILAIGDGINTDMRGAAEAELDSLFIAGGLHASDLRTIATAEKGEQTDGAGDLLYDGTLLSKLFAGQQLPVAAMRGLA